MDRLSDADHSALANLQLVDSESKYDTHAIPGISNATAVHNSTDDDSARSSQESISRNGEDDSDALSRPRSSNGSSDTGTVVLPLTVATDMSTVSDEDIDRILTRPLAAIWYKHYRDIKSAIPYFLVIDEQWTQYSDRAFASPVPQDAEQAAKLEAWLEGQDRDHSSPAYAIENLRHWAQRAAQRLDSVTDLLFSSIYAFNIVDGRVLIILCQYRVLANSLRALAENGEEDLYDDAWDRLHGQDFFEEKLGIFRSEYVKDVIAERGLYR